MNNTFRTGKGIVLDGYWPEPSVIRSNRFINSYHAVNIFGATAHVLDNHFSVPEPERVPIAGFPDEAIRIFPRVREAGDTLPAVCGRNVVAGNRIEGALIGIEIRVREADTRCEGNVIRDKWIAVTFARVPEWSPVPAPDDSLVVYGLALALDDVAAEGSGAESDTAGPRISGNVIEGNRIIGGPGPAIQLYGAADNRIVDNTITGVRLRETYPGHTLYLPPPGTDANGAGIWISPGSDDNEILGNTFEDIASYALVIEGDDNYVELRKANDEVRDQGSGNRISGPPSNRKAKNRDLDPYRRTLPSGSDPVGAARVMGMDDELGPVASGKLADLILVDGGQDRFRRALDRVRLVRLDVSTVYGCECRETPELIEPYIRRFLDEVKATELQPTGATFRG